MPKRYLGDNHTILSRLTWKMDKPVPDNPTQHPARRTPDAHIKRAPRALQARLLQKADPNLLQKHLEPRASSLRVFSAIDLMVMTPKIVSHGKFLVCTGPHMFCHFLIFFMIMQRIFV